MSDVEIRPYRADDRARVGAIDTGLTIDSVAVLAVDGGRISWTAVPAAPRAKSHDLAGALADPAPSWTEAFVAERADGVVGFAAVGYESWNGRAVLWHLYVDPSSRRLGIARALVGAAVDRARAAGCRQLWLETQDSNVPAIAAYERLGFEIVGFDRSLYGNPPDAETAVFMAMGLG